MKNQKILNNQNKLIKGATFNLSDIFSFLHLHFFRLVASNAVLDFINSF